MLIVVTLSYLYPALVDIKSDILSPKHYKAAAEVFYFH